MASRAGNPVETCRETALRLLGQRGHSTAELRRKLSARGYAAAVLEEVVGDLTRVGLLDDLAFAKAYCEYRRQGSRAAGATRILAELRQRGVATDVADQALRDTAPEDDADTDETRALEVARRRWASLKTLPDPRAARARLGRFLAGRGFSATVCRAVLDRLESEDS